jgi:hypothetical protein
MKRKYDAVKAIELVAMKNGVSAEDVLQDIKHAIFIGMCSQDPAVQMRWREVPCKGEYPTPEELIAYIAANVDGKSLL